ncbi:MAG: hypothetical protein HYU36_13245 [Planctomycetes bacterium]|nr:hypothetical protein [Planctomycetota bacterium]
MRRVLPLFLMLTAQGVFPEESPLHLSKGPVDALASDRGWRSTDALPKEKEPNQPVAVATDPDVPEALSASIQEAGRLERLEASPRGLYLDTRAGHLRVDNAGQGNRFAGTDAFTPFEGDFILEFEMTAALVGSAPAVFGLSDQPENLLGAPHALILEYGMLEYRRPILRWMARTPETALKELGRVADIGWVADKRIRLAREGDRLKLTVQQDYLKEAAIEATLPHSGRFSWLGAQFAAPVTAKRGQRSILLIDNIGGLDPKSPGSPVATPPVGFQFPESAAGGSWPPRVLSGGLDVTGPEYADEAGLERPLKLEAADLSDAAGWPQIRAEAGTVLCDARTRRIRFSDGLGRPIRRIGSLDLPRGTPRHVVVQGGWAYLAHGDGGPSSHLVILDVSEPRTPRVASTLALNWWPEDLEVAGGLAYVPDGVTLQVVDVSRPESPRVVSRYEEDLGMERGEARRVAIEGGRAYLAVSKRGLLVLDVSDAAHPKLLGRADAPQLRYPADVLARGRYVWMASELGLQIFDVSDPRKPALLRSGGAAPKTRRPDAPDLGLEEEEEEGNGVKRGVSLQDYETAKQPLRLFLSESYLYVVDQKEGLLVLDVSDPFRPELMGRYQPAPRISVPGIEVHATSVWVDGQTAYLAVNHGFAVQKSDADGETASIDLGGGLHILDVADPIEPVLVARHVERETFTNTVDVVARGGCAYLSDAAFGLWTVDVSDRRQPVLLGGAATQGEIRDLAIEGSTAYLASGNGQGVLAVDVSDPSKPAVRGRYHTGFDAPSLAVRDGRVYLGCRDWSLPYGLQVIDFRDPARPERVASVSATAAGQWTECQGLLFSSAGEVFSLKDPLRPAAYGKLPGGALLRDRNLFFLAQPNVANGLTVLDTSRTGDDVVVSQLAVYLDSSVHGSVARRGRTLFLAGGTEGVAIVDVRDPARPRLLKKLKGNIGSAVDVSVHGSYLAVTDLYAGIKLYDAARPETPRLKAIYPPPGDPVCLAGYRSVIRGGRLYRARLDGLDVLELPAPPEAPPGKVTLKPR